MELIFSSGVLTVLLLVGAFVDFLVTPSSRPTVYRGDGFSDEPRRAPAAQFPADRADEYDYAA